jgi:hypothetical protein
VADRAHRLLIWIRELTDVTSDTRIVSGEIELKRLPFAAMTRIAFELFVLGDAVRELLELALRCTHRNRVGRLGCGDRYRSFIRLLDTTRHRRRESANNNR